MATFALQSIFCWGNKRRIYNNNHCLWLAKVKFSYIYTCQHSCFMLNSIHANICSTMSKIHTTLILFLAFRSRREHFWEAQKTGDSINIVLASASLYNAQSIQRSFQLEPGVTRTFLYGYMWLVFHLKCKKFIMYNKQRLFKTIYKMTQQKCERLSGLQRQWRPKGRQPIRVYLHLYVYRKLY